MAKQEDLLRLINLIPFLAENQGITVQKAAEFFHSDEKTILKDLDQILMCGVPPYYPSDYIGVYLEENRIYIQFAKHFKRPIRLNLDEALSLRMALESFPQESDSPYKLTIQSLLDKIEDVLPEWEQSEFTNYPSRFQDPHCPVRSKILYTLEKAVKNAQVCRLVYFSPEKESLSSREVESQGLIFHEGFWYLIAYCRLRQKILEFRLDRMKEATLTEEFFVKKEVDLEAYKKASMLPKEALKTQVTLWFHKNVARYIQEEYPKESIQMLPQGHLELKMKIASTRWLFSWLVEYGPMGKILEPDTIRQEYRQLLQKTIARYS